MFCRICGKEIPEGRVVCDECVQKEAYKAKYCQKCGTAIDEEQKECPECGTKPTNISLEKIRYLKNYPTYRSSVKKISLSALFMGIIGILISAAIIFLPIFTATYMKVGVGVVSENFSFFDEILRMIDCFKAGAIEQNLTTLILSVAAIPVTVLMVLALVKLVLGVFGYIKRIVEYSSKLIHHDDTTVLRTWELSKKGAVGRLGKLFPFSDITLQIIAVALDVIVCGIGLKHLSGLLANIGSEIRIEAIENFFKAGDGATWRYMFSFSGFSWLVYIAVALVTLYYAGAIIISLYSRRIAASLSEASEEPKKEEEKAEENTENGEENTEEKPAEKSAEEKKPEEKTAEKSAEEKKPEEKPAEKPAEEKKPEEKPAEKPAEEKKPEEKTAEKSAEEKKPEEKPAEKPTEEKTESKPSSSECKAESAEATKIVSSPDKTASAEAEKSAEKEKAEEPKEKKEPEKAESSDEKEKQADSKEEKSEEENSEEEKSEEDKEEKKEAKIDPKSPEVAYLKFKAPLKKKSILNLVSCALALVFSLTLIFLPTFTVAEGAIFSVSMEGSYSLFDELLSVFDQLTQGVPNDASFIINASLTAVLFLILIISTVGFLVGTIRYAVTLRKDKSCISGYKKIYKAKMESKLKHRRIGAPNVSTAMFAAIYCALIAKLVCMFVPAAEGGVSLMHITGISVLLLVPVVLCIGVLVLNFIIKKISKNIMLSIAKDHFLIK